MHRNLLSVQVMNITWCDKKFSAGIYLWWYGIEYGMIIVRYDMVRSLSIIRTRDHCIILDYKVMLRQVIDG